MIPKRAILDSNDNNAATCHTGSNISSRLNNVEIGMRIFFARRISLFTDMEVY